MPISNSDNLFGVTQFIVDPVASKGSFTTITSAIAAAALAGSGVVYIRPGVTYVESFVLPANIHLTTLSSSTAVQDASRATIDGTITISSAGSHSMSNLVFKPAGLATVPILITGANSPVSEFLNCVWNQAAGGAENIVSTATANPVNIFTNCTFSGVGPALITSTAGQYYLNWCTMGNIVNSSLVSLSGPIGSFNLFNCSWAAAVQLAGSTAFSIQNSTMATDNVGGALVLGGTNTATIFQSTLAASAVAAAAITIGAGCTCNINQASIFSSNATFAVSGTGAFTYGLLEFPGSNTSIDPGLTTTLQTIRPFATTTDRGVASFNSSDFTVSAAGQVSLVGSGGFQWNTTSINVAAMTVDNGYFCIAPGGALTLGLPATSVLGDTIKVSLKGATSWQITQPNAGSQIVLGNASTSLGVGGSITSTLQGDSIELVCLTTNGIWVAQNSVGNLTVV